MGFFDKLTGSSTEEIQRMQDRVHRLESENILIKQDFSNRLARLEGMFGWLRVLGACSERDPALDTAWALFQDFLGMKKGALYLPSEKGWTPLRQIGFFPVAPVILREDQSALGRAMREGVPLVVDQEFDAPDGVGAAGSGVVPDVLRVFPFETASGNFGALVLCEKARTSFSEVGETEFGMTVAFLLEMYFKRVEWAKAPSHVPVEPQVDPRSMESLEVSQPGVSAPFPPSRGSDETFLAGPMVLRLENEPKNHVPDDALLPIIAVAEQPAAELHEGPASFPDTGDEKLTEMKVPLSVLKSTAQPLSEGNPHDLFDLSLDLPSPKPQIEFPVSEKSDEIIDLNLDLPALTMEPQTTLPPSQLLEQRIEIVAKTEIPPADDLLSPSEVFGISLELPEIPRNVEGISQLPAQKDIPPAMIPKNESLPQPETTQDNPLDQPPENTLIIDEPSIDLGGHQEIPLFASDDPGHLVLTEETALHIPTLIDEPSPGDLEITLPDEQDLGLEVTSPSEIESELRISDAELHLELPTTIDEHVTIEEPVSSGKSLEWELAKKLEIEKKWQDLSLDFSSTEDRLPPSDQDETMKPPEEAPAPQTYGSSEKIDQEKLLQSTQSAQRKNNKQESKSEDMPESDPESEKPQAPAPAENEVSNSDENILESGALSEILVEDSAQKDHQAVNSARDLVSKPKVLPMTNPLAGSGVDLLGIVVLFLKIRGFSPLIGQLPPEKTMEILGRYFSSMTAIILGHQGMIEKLIGDTVMATFNTRSSDAPENNTPSMTFSGHTPHRGDTNPAFQAFNAAVGIRRRFDQIIRETLPNTLSTPALGVGLHYQELMLGLGEDEKELLAAAKDEGFRLASRLSSLADDGEILFDKSVYQCLQDGQDGFPPQEKILLKDENDPLKIYSCQSEAPEAGEDEGFPSTTEVNSPTIPDRGPRGEAEAGSKASLGRHTVHPQKYPVEDPSSAETVEPAEDPDLSAAIDFLKLEEAQEDRDGTPPA